MRVVKKLTDNKFINIKEIKDPSKHVSGYQFAERLGKDSVAFILWDEYDSHFLLNEEYKPPIDKFLLGAFGGSIDKDKSPEEIVIAEAKEEAGFTVEASDVHYVGEVMVSTQMNQMCKLYIVMVDRNQQGTREPENKVEEMAKIKWVAKYSMDLYDLEDWKPIIIISKSLSQGIIKS